MLNRKIASALLTAATFVTTSGFASAATLPTETTDTLRFQTHCEAIKDHVQVRSEKVKEIRGLRRQLFRGAEKMSEKMFSRFDAAGLDTSKLKEYLSVVDQKVAALKAEHESALDSVQRPVIDCNATPEENKAAMEQFRQTVKPLRTELRDGMKDLHTYVHGTVRPEIKSLREQMKALNQ